MADRQVQMPLDFGPLLSAALDEMIRGAIRQELREVIGHLSSAAATAPKIDCNSAPQARRPFRLVEEVAEDCGVKPATVRAWINSGRLPARKVGHRYLINPRDLDTFVASNETGKSGSAAVDDNVAQIMGSISRLVR